MDNFSAEAEPLTMEKVIAADLWARSRARELLEALRRAEQPGAQEVEQRPQVAQAVLHRGSGEGQSRLALEGLHRPGLAGAATTGSGAGGGGVGAGVCGTMVCTAGGALGGRLSALVLNSISSGACSAIW